MHFNLKTAEYNLIWYWVQTYVKQIFDDIIFSIPQTSSSGVMQVVPHLLILQNFKALRQPILGEDIRERSERKEKQEGITLHIVNFCWKLLVYLTGIIFIIWFEFIHFTYALCGNLMAI